jgi:methyl-accepting chemotaxis protein
MSFEGYQEALESQKNKEDELSAMKQQFNTMQSQLQTLITALGSAKDQNQVNHTAEMLYKAGILNLS